LKFGPLDHGRRVSASAIETAEYAPGFKYEVIEGRLYVSPQPNPPEFLLERWLRLALERYSEEHPDILNVVAVKGRVFLPDGELLTVPEPDLAAYSDYPLDCPMEEVRWDETSPFLVCEIMVGGSIDKDLSRNPRLYLAVPSIKEYWVVNGSENPNEPTLVQHRRRGKQWVVTHFPFQSTFTTPLLPDFALVIDPRPRRRKKS
jgi:Uma2 family endonuclease